LEEWITFPKMLERIDNPRDGRRRRYNALVFIQAQVLVLLILVSLVLSELLLHAHRANVFFDLATQLLPLLSAMPPAPSHNHTALVN
jgi:hypothetical protein